MTLNETISQWNFCLTAYFGIVFAEFADWNSLTNSEQAEWKSLCEKADAGIANMGNMTITEFQSSVAETQERTRLLLLSIRDRIISSFANGTLKPSSQKLRSPIAFSRN